MVRTKSVTIRAKRCGWSLCGKCPLLGITSMRERGAMAAARLACRTGMTLSSRPQTTHMGIAWVRYARSAMVTICPRQSTTARTTWRIAARAAGSLKES